MAVLFLELGRLDWDGKKISAESSLWEILGYVSEASNGFPPRPRHLERAKFLTRILPIDDPDQLGIVMPECYADKPVELVDVVSMPDSKGWT